MTRISSMFVASALAVLPISAFAQQDTAAAEVAAPNAVVSPMVSSHTTPGNKPTAANAEKPATKATPATGGKTEVHGLNTLKSHDGKTIAPAVGRPDRSLEVLTFPTGGTKWLPRGCSNSDRESPGPATTMAGSRRCRGSKPYSRRLGSKTEFHHPGRHP